MRIIKDASLYLLTDQSGDYTSAAIDIHHLYGYAYQSDWTVKSFSSKTFDSGVFASKILQDLTFTAKTIGVGGNSITVAYTDDGCAGEEEVSLTGSAISVKMQAAHADKTFDSGVFASKAMQDLTYTSKTIGVGGNSTTVEYTTGATAGAEVVTVALNAITVQIEDGVSTANQIKTAVEASTVAMALVGVAVSGTGTNTQVAMVATNLENGAATNINLTSNEVTISTHGFHTGSKIRLTTSGGLPSPLLTATDYYVIVVNANTIKLASSLALAKAGTEIDITTYGTGTQTATTTTSTANMIKAAIEAYTTANALVAIVVSGTGTTTQTAMVATALENGAATNINLTTNEVTISSHGYCTGLKISGITTTTTLPTGLSLLTPYYVIKVDTNTIKLAATYADAIAGTEIDITGYGAGTHTIAITALSGASIKLQGSVNGTTYQDITSTATNITATGGVLLNVDGAHYSNLRAVITLPSGAIDIAAYICAKGI